MIHPYDLKHFIIIPTLILMERFIPEIGSIPAIDLLCGTIAQESSCGHRLQDADKGETLGIYNMGQDVYESTLEYMQEKLIDTSTYGHTTIWNAMHYSQSFNIFHANAEQMVHDLRFATVMARMHYWRQEETLPTEINFFTDENSEEHQKYIHELAHYWGRYYGKSLATKSKVLEFFNNFISFEELL